MPAWPLHLTEMLARSFESGNTFVNNIVKFPLKERANRAPAVNQAVNAGLTLLSLQERVPDFAGTAPF